jgi:hypothetical protein
MLEALPPPSADTEAPPPPSSRPDIHRDRLQGGRHGPLPFQGGPDDVLARVQRLGVESIQVARGQVVYFWTMEIEEAMGVPLEQSTRTLQSQPRRYATCRQYHSAGRRPGRVCPRGHRAGDERRECRGTERGVGGRAGRPPLAAPPPNADRAPHSTTGKRPGWGPGRLGPLALWQPRLRKRQLDLAAPAGVAGRGQYRRGAAGRAEGGARAVNARGGERSCGR